MISDKNITFVVMLLCLLFGLGIAISAYSDPSEKETQDYSAEMARVKTMKESFTSGPTNDLDKFEKYADEIQQAWSQSNKEYYARLMLAICEPLSSGNFKSDRRHELARKYALAALDNANAIPLTLEIELTLHVTTSMMESNGMKDEDFAERRRKDVEVRLHAWKRLRDNIDTKWDPNERLSAQVPLPPGVNGEWGMSPKEIKDDVLRAKYEKDIEENKQKNQRYSVQRNLRLSMKIFPNHAENYIIKAYSHAPYNIAELEKSLDEYKVDENTKVRILDAVKKDSQEVKKK